MSIDIRDFFSYFPLFLELLFLSLFTLLTPFHCEQPACYCNVTHSLKTEDPELWETHLVYSFVAKIAQKISILSLQSLDGNISFPLTSWYYICFSSASELDRPEVIPLPIHLHLDFLHSACQTLLQKGDKAGTWQIGTVIVFNMPQKSRTKYLNVSPFFLILHSAEICCHYKGHWPMKQLKRQKLFLPFRVCTQAEAIT